MVTLTTKLFHLHNEVYYQALFIPAPAVEELLRDATDRRVICKINGDFSWHAALMHTGDGDYFINVSKEVRKRANLVPDQEGIQVELRKDESEYGMPVPEELIELWAMDQEGWDVFNQLTPGKQRSLLYIIAKPKTSGTRIKKAVQINDYLKSTSGKLNYKELNAYMKSQNKP
ncbi:MAG: YdeI/OmpD-associated family protein [Bacteroidota bacterium]